MSVYNGEQFLAESVQSILDQSFADFEFIIIDDGSTDSTALMLKEFANRDSRVRIFSQENRGRVDSLNRASAMSRCKYLARMDADDVAVRDRLLWQVQFMENHPEVGVVGGYVDYINEVGNVVGTRHLPTTNGEIQAALLTDCVLVHPAVLIRKDAFFSAGGYRKAVLEAEDYDLWLRIADRFQLANVSRVVLKYRHHSHQVSVQHCRAQALSAVTARAATLARRGGKADPLESAEVITPEILQELGVSESMQQAYLCRQYLGRINSLYTAGEYSCASRLACDILNSPELAQAERWVAADIRLLVARIHWQHSRVWDSLCAVSHAAMIRPTILARPLKRLSQRPNS